MPTMMVRCSPEIRTELRGGQDDGSNLDYPAHPAGSRGAGGLKVREVLDAG